jgi:hypothetical protein
MIAETLPACPRCGHAAERVQLGEWHLVRCSSKSVCKQRAARKKTAGAADFDWTIRAMGRVRVDGILSRVVKPEQARIK